MGIASIRLKFYAFEILPGGTFKCKGLAVRCTVNTNDIVKYNECAFLNELKTNTSKALNHEFMFYNMLFIQIFIWFNIAL